jgi:hypothetical protein
VIEVKKVAFVVLALALLMMFGAVAPAFAFTAQHSKITRIPFTLTVYVVGYSPPTKTWYTCNNQIYHDSGSVVTMISLEQPYPLVTSVSNGLYFEFNFLSGKGYAISKFVDTYAEGSLIGMGRMEGITISRTTTPDNMVASGYIVAYGSSNLYCHITEYSTVSWHPVETPFPTLEVTVTGVYIVQN